MISLNSAAGVLRLTTRVVVWATTVPPAEPFPPVDQDADAIRVEACELVSDDPANCVVDTLPPDTVPSGGGGGADLSFFSLLLWLLLIAAVVGLLLLVLRGTGLVGRGKRAKKKSDEESDDDTDDELDGVIGDREVFVDRSREPLDWRGEADAHRRAGRYRDAVRCRYRALVGDLARRGLIDEIPGRTTGEHRGQVHSVVPEAAAPFDEAAELFDGAWYGHYDVDERDDDRFVALESAVLARAGARAGVRHGVRDGVRDEEPRG